MLSVTLNERVRWSIVLAPDRPDYFRDMLSHESGTHVLACMI